MFNRNKLAGACAILAVCGASSANALVFNGIPYMDDRSTPQAVIESYYNAINRKEYVQAYSYFSTPPKNFEEWKEGFLTTESVQLRYGSTQPDAGMSQLYWPLPVAIETHLSDGTSQVYAGCYVLHMVVPGTITDPPYSPIAINKGELKPTDKPLSQALPDKCDE
jgi:hypothetical protein